MYQATIWVGSTGVGNGIGPAISHAVGEVGGGWILSPYSLPHWDVDMPALRQLSFTAHLQIIPIDSPALEKIRMRDCPKKPQRGRIQSTKRLHIRDCANGFLSQLGRIIHNWKIAESRLLTGNRAATKRSAHDTRPTRNPTNPSGVDAHGKLQSLTCDILPALNNRGCAGSLCIEDEHATSLSSLTGLRTLKTLTLMCERLTVFPDPVNMTALMRLELCDCTSSAFSIVGPA
jgi:hypothetical protein